ALVSIDKTAPTISAQVDRAANSNGWYRDDVTVKFTCEDTISGIYSCPAAKTLGEGANQIVSGKASDAAGNLSAEVTHTAISVDKTDPTISGAAMTAANANGWYNGDVSIKWSCADALSGINGSCPANTTLTGEGANLSASASISDKAGNSASTTVSGIKIDRNAPTISGKATTDPNSNGWYNGSVTIRFTCDDALSTVASCPTDVTLSGAGANQSVSGTATDKAGNTASVTVSGISIDLTKPTISGAATTQPNANGWYNSDVTVKWTCADTLSGIASCSIDSMLTSEGANHSVKGDATDNAGNTATATVSGINLDKTAPEVTIKGITNGGVYTLGAVPAASCSATDSLSGVAGTCSGTLSGGTTNGVGSFTYTATATDKAGNTSTPVTVKYQVVYGYGTTFFLQPINDTAHQTGVSTSVFKAGSTVPVKFQIKKADGTIVQANNAPQWLTPAKGSSTSAAVDESVYSDAASSGTTFKWDATAQQYIYNWSTKGVAANFYYRIGVTLDDGQTYFVNIGLR
ncbi:MAG: PxKF domain-containing protein, partial [Chloroflexi bacterium]|nr:PxKF domain-containing protein [Chloroflexota bacterium]